MPYKPKTPCAYSMCPNLTEPGQSYCEEHRKLKHRQHKTSRTDTGIQKIYKGTRWRKLRAKKLALNPFCEICEQEGRTEPAVIVDHIKEIKNGGAIWDMQNLQSLCFACHNRKTFGKQV